MSDKLATGILAVALSAVILLIAGCEKEQPCRGEPLIFTSLTVSPDTIDTGDYADVTAVARGCQLSYHWSVTRGSILGTGAEVTFAASPCSIGDNTITCTVKDGNDQSETRTVRIVIR